MARCLICGKDCNTGDYHTVCAKKLFGSKKIPVFTYSMENLNHLAKQLITSRVSVPGVQAKLSLHIERVTDGVDRLTLVGLDGDYILKLPTVNYPELPESEHFSMMLANRCGIRTALFGLVRLNFGGYAYITRRMDRDGGIKAMEDFCQLTERPTEKKYFGSYEQIGKLIHRYVTFGGVDALRFFEVVLFCYLTGNNDMHLKNFSLLRETNAEWNLSPAYDLVPAQIFLPDDLEELALTLNGKKRRFVVNDFVSFANSLHLTSTQYMRAIQRICKCLKTSITDVCASSFLSIEFQTKFCKLLDKRLLLFNNIL